MYISFLVSIQSSYEKCYVNDETLRNQYIYKTSGTTFSKSCSPKINLLKTFHPFSRVHSKTLIAKCERDFKEASQQDPSDFPPPSFRGEERDLDF